MNRHRSDKTRTEGPTPLFLGYCARLLVRLALLAFATWLFVTDPSALDASATFGVPGGLNFIDVVFIALMFDFLTKFFVHARISSGSLKQYGLYHIPTPATFRGGREALRAQFQEIAEFGHRLAANGVTAIQETYDGLMARGGSLASFVRRLLNSVDFLNIFHFDNKDLAVDRSIRAVLYRDRLREIVPVIVFWVTFNVLVAGLMAWFGVLNERTALIWSLCYFVSDMVCVVLWCPLQVLLMRNRCCTTCQIFNWDAIMVVTPLLFVGGWFGWILIAFAIVILVRWELAAVRHPERFDERTNARLTCAQCVDKLCYLRKPFISVTQKAVLPQAGSPELPASATHVSKMG
ncbi:MAG: hypothetical protein U0L71_06275 [Eggerthellaceae bacterium]|nr:hypothetical protein [Eggerthellaceae bacterium]